MKQNKFPCVLLYMLVACHLTYTLHANMTCPSYVIEKKKKKNHVLLCELIFYNLSTKIGLWNKQIQQWQMFLLRMVFVNGYKIELFLLFSFWSWRERDWNIKIHSTFLKEKTWLRAREKLPSFREDISHENCSAAYHKKVICGLHVWAILGQCQFFFFF